MKRRRAALPIVLLIGASLIALALAATAPPVAAGGSIVGQRGGEQAVLFPAAILKPEALRFPTRLAVAGDELIVLDRYSRQAVTALDRVSGRVRRAFGRHGQGPAELFGPFAIAADGTGVVVLDASMNRLTYLSASEGSNAFRLAGVVPMTEGPFIDVVATGPNTRVPSRHSQLRVDHPRVRPGGEPDGGARTRQRHHRHRVA